jgi:REP element-mobilizing transposase RayT
MSQSLANVILHNVFSTKERRPFLHTPELRNTLTGYLVGTLQNLKCPSLNVGVVQDHVHILCHLSRTITIADLIGELKSSSSERLKQEGRDVSSFYGQNGYGAFSVSESMVPTVKAYIADQESHHKRMSFQDEFRQLLTRHRIKFDERYVWD